MIILTKNLFIENPKLNIFTYFTIRGGIFFLVNSLMVYYQKVKIFTVAKEARWLLLVRGLLDTTVVIGFFYAVTLIVATKATLLYNLQSVFVTVLAIIFLKEKIFLLDIFTLTGSFIGVFLLSSEDDQENTNVSYLIQILGILVCLLEALTRSVIIIIIKKMNKYLHYMFSPFYFSLTMF